MSGLDLYLSQRTLALLFVYAALIGFGLGAVFDALRILRIPFGDLYVRRHGKHSSPPSVGKERISPVLAVLRFLCDLLFMLIAFVALILLCYYQNDGQLRAPAPVGMACGFFVYRHTVSPWVLSLASALLKQTHRALIAVLRLLAVPLRWLWRITVGRWIASVQSTLREKQTARRMQALTDAASRGFDLLGEPLREPLKEPLKEPPESEVK
jgi:hypothetical protein